MGVNLYHTLDNVEVVKPPILFCTAVDEKYENIGIKLGCSLNWVIQCGEEVSAAWEQCENDENIMDCTKNILGDSECCLCLCETLDWMGLVDWSTCIAG